MTAELVLYIILAAVAVPSAILMVVVKNPVHSALWLVVNFFAVAMLFLVLNAEFLAFVQVLIYAGAIMVLFLFVIMLLNLTGEIERLPDPLKGQTWVAPLLAAVFFVETIAIVRSGVFGGPVAARPPQGFGGAYPLGQVLFTKYLFPFEVTSIVLLIGMVGAIVLAKRRY